MKMHIKCIGHVKKQNTDEEREREKEGDQKADNWGSSKKGM